MSGTNYLDGDLAHPAGGVGPAGAEAVCVDSTYGGGLGGVSGPYSLNLADTTGAWACGLTTLQGNFRTYNYDGPELLYDTRTKQWRLTSTDGKGPRPRA